MSKGGKSRQNNVYTARTRVVENSAYVAAINSGSGGDSGSARKVKNCWDFQLINETTNVQKVKINSAVKGTIIQDNQLVLIRYGAEPLGYAPHSISMEIIEASKSKTGYLVGKIISKTEDNKNASINLCLT